MIAVTVRGDFDALDIEEAVEVGLTVLSLLMDVSERSMAMSLAVLMGERLAVAGTTEPLTWTGMHELAVRESMVADVRLTENELGCGNLFM